MADAAAVGRVSCTGAAAATGRGRDRGLDVLDRCEQRQRQVSDPGEEREDATEDEKPASTVDLASGEGHRSIIPCPTRDASRGAADAARPQGSGAPAVDRPAELLLGHEHLGVLVEALAAEERSGRGQSAQTTISTTPSSSEPTPTRTPRRRRTAPCSRSPGRACRSPTSRTRRSAARPRAAGTGT